MCLSSTVRRATPWVCAVLCCLSILSISSVPAASARTLTYNGCYGNIFDGRCYECPKGVDVTVEFGKDGPTCKCADDSACNVFWLDGDDHDDRDDGDD
jgi:hypothetical protein